MAPGTQEVDPAGGEDGAGGSSRTCSRCGQTLAAGAKFCGACGQATPEQARRRRWALSADTAQAYRNMRTIGLVFGGTLLSIVILLRLDREDLDLWLFTALDLVFTLAVGLLGVLLLGRKGWTRSLAELPGAGTVVLGLAAGACTYGVATLWLEILTGVLPVMEIDFREEGILWQGLLLIAVMPALLEEWLCRGVLWAACQPTLSPRATILTTALLFTLIHVPSWGFFGLPVIFVCGVAFGWLRLRSASLVPGMMAHFVHNGLVIVLG